MSGSGWSTGLLSKAGGGRGRSNFFLERWWRRGSGVARSRELKDGRTDGYFSSDNSHEILAR